MESKKQVSVRYTSDLKKLNMVYFSIQILAQSYFHYTQMIFQLIYKEQRRALFADDTIIPAHPPQKIELCSSY